MNLLKASIVLFMAFLVAFLAATGNLQAALVTGALSSVAVAGWMAPELSGQFCANTLTNLIPDAYKALDVVSRELVGFIPGVTRDAAVDRVAIGQNIRSFKTRANTAGRDITAAMSIPSASDQTIDNEPITISKSRAFPFSWSGEQRYAVDQGPGALTIAQDQIAQAIRAAVNEVEVDIAVALKNGASRAYGTAGTTPFASTLGDPAQLRKILDDNGTPSSDRHLVIDTTAGAKLRTLAQLTKVNESGDSSLLRQGALLDIHGFAIRESAQVQTTTAGTGASYQINNVAGYAIGDTALTLDTGSGTILAGDVLTIGNHKYVVASALSANVVTIAAPGLREAVANDATVTVNATSTRNIGYRRSAVVLAARLPELNPEGDMAIDRETITDPLSGLSFEIAAYPGYRMITYEVALAWGVKVIKPEHVAVLLG